KISEAVGLDVSTIQLVLKRLVTAGEIEFEKEDGQVRLVSATRDFALGWRPRASGKRRENAPAPEARERRCLTCGTIFMSDHIGNRICPDCKASRVYKNVMAYGM
ncbi:MAG: hypothetical protein AAF394_14815, partial [Planctomycetota bacterium]